MEKQLSEDVAVLVAVAESYGFLVMTGDDFDEPTNGLHWDRGDCFG